jgi:hypothetical protein
MVSIRRPREVKIRPVVTLAKARSTRSAAVRSGCSSAAACFRL